MKNPAAKIEEIKKLMPKIFKLLEESGSESLKNAKNHLRTLELETPAAREALERYAENWNDTIHPALLALSYDAVADETAKVVDLQTVVLFLTAAMDIHDDVIDKSRTKGGKPTIYGEFGEDLAVLLGDALLFEGLMMLQKFQSSTNPESYKAIMETVNDAFFEVGNAHLIELQLKKKTNVNPKDILNVIEKKAAIFEAICKIGAIVGKGSKKQIDALKTWGRTFGFLVMLREEFIDMFEPEELMGRMKNEYLPIPIIYAFKDAKASTTVARLSNSMVTEDGIDNLIDMVYANEKVKKLKETMEDRAKQAVDVVSSSNLKNKPVLTLSTLVMGTLEDL
jgi:geranylgeranyl pyrophosphate synthase